MSHSRPWRAALLVLWAAAGVAPWGCRTIDDTWGLPPLFEVYPNPSRVGATQGSEARIRPLIGMERLRDDDARPRNNGYAARLAPPIVDLRWSRGDVRHWVLPVAYLRRYTTPEGGTDIDWMLVPFLGGTDSREGGYFAVFPFGGTLKGLLAKDDITVVLFPLYFSSRDRERRSAHVVWPFFNTVWGGGWSGWRLWPFWGFYQSESHLGALRYDSWFAMWPFVIRQRSHAGIEPTDLLFLFPFYGVRENARVVTRTVAWPLFQYSYNKRYGRASSFGFLIPYRFEEGQSDLWPLFGLKRKEHGWDMDGVYYRRLRQYLLWPVQRYEWSTDGIEEVTRLWLAPILWHFHTIDKESLSTRVEWLLWPLFRFTRDGEETAFDTIYPVPYRREDYYRYYSRLFSVFRYRGGPDRLGVEVLYGAMAFMSGPDDGEFEVSLLGGLLAFGSTGAGFRARVLYIPWW